MAKINRHIEIVASSRHELNSMSTKTRETIQAVLSKEYAQVGITLVNNLSDLTALTLRRPDMVFLGMKFVPEDTELGLSDPHKIWVSEYLEKRGIRYTGSGHTAIRLELNKDLAKQQVAAAGLRTAKFQVIRRDEHVTANKVTLTYPLFVKPTNRGGGLGVDAESLVHNFYQLRAKVRSLSVRLQSDALIEEYLPGREFSVGILKEADTDQYMVMPLELVAPINKSGARILSAQIKSADTEYNLAVTDTRLKAKINALAIGAFRAIGARDYGRIDIRLDAEGVPHFLEANLLPSLKNSYGNYFPKACLLNMKLKYEPMLHEIISLAFSRDNDEEVELRGLNPLQGIVSLLTPRESITEPVDL